MPPAVRTLTTLPSEPVVSMPSSALRSRKRLRKTARPSRPFRPKYAAVTEPPETPATKSTASVSGRGPAPVRIVSRSSAVRTPWRERRGAGAAVREGEPDDGVVDLGGLRPAALIRDRGEPGVD